MAACFLQAVALCLLKEYPARRHFPQSGHRVHFFSWRLQSLKLPNNFPQTLHSIV
jgi:hypothetical protein